MSGLSKHLSNKETLETMPNGNLPPYVRIAVWIVERLGFPVFATGVILWMANTSMVKLTAAVDQNSKVLTEFRNESIRFQDSVTSQHNLMMDEMRRMKQ